MATTRYISVIQDVATTGDFEKDAFWDIGQAMGFQGGNDDGLLGQPTEEALRECMKGAKNDPDWKDYKVLKITIELL